MSMNLPEIVFRTARKTLEFWEVPANDAAKIFDAPEIATLAEIDKLELNERREEICRKIAGLNYRLWKKFPQRSLAATWMKQVHSHGISPLQLIVSAEDPVSAIASLIEEIQSNT